jgi:hypothetical protein
MLRHDKYAEQFCYSDIIFTHYYRCSFYDRIRIQSGYGSETLSDSQRRAAVSGGGVRYCNALYLKLRDNIVGLGCGHGRGG